jgi:hypothetical protein
MIDTNISDVSIQIAENESATPHEVIPASPVVVAEIKTSDAPTSPQTGGSTGKTVAERQQSQLFTLDKR